MERAGFKEWSIVCDALGRGEQCLILRKGGIAEARSGFAFKHTEFFLFPTHFHEQTNNVRGHRSPRPPGEEIKIECFVRLERVEEVRSIAAAHSLAPLHILKPQVVESRFAYGKEAGLLVAFVRVFRLKPTWSLAPSKRYAGCKSWVKLPEPPGFELKAVLTVAEHEKRAKQFDGLVSDQKL